MSESTGAPSTGSQAAAAPAPTAGAQTQNTQANPEGSQGGAAKEQKQAIAEMKKKFNLTVDGETFEEEVDLNDEVGMTKRLQMAKAAEKRIGEAKTTKAKAMEIIKALEGDPAALIKKMGLKQGEKGREMLEKILVETIKEEMMTQEERDALTRDKKLKMYEEQEENRKKDEETKAAKATEDKYAAQYETTILDALKKCGLPKSPRLIKEMASIMSKNIDMGLDLSSDDLAQIVRSDKIDLIKALVTDADDGDQLVALLGEDAAKKIRKSDLKRLQDSQDKVFQPRNQNQNSPAPAADQRPKKLTEWKEDLAKRYDK